MEPILYDGPERWEGMTGKQAMVRYLTTRINREVYQGKMFDRMLKNPGCSKSQKELAEENREQCWWRATAYKMVLDDVIAGRMDEWLHKGIVQHVEDKARCRP